MENEQPKPNEEVVKEAVEQVAEDVKQEQPVNDRPDINYQREIERRKAEADRLRQELEVEKNRQVNRRDQNDITTWSDLELKALAKSNDPSVLAYKDQAEEILLERKVKQIRERERMAEKRAVTEVELRSKYPEAMDPYSDFSAQMEKVMFDLDLQKSPAGRLAAAKIVAAEFQKGSGKTNAAGRKQEEARLKDVKQTLAEGDRPDPRGNLPKPVKTEDVIKALNNDKDAAGQSQAMDALLKAKGLSRKDLFGY